MITDTAENGSDVTPAPGPDPEAAKPHPAALVPAVLGVTALVAAQLLPWSAVTIGNGADAVFGGAAPRTVGVYWLDQLYPAQVPLYLGWVMLIGFFVAAWRLPAGSRALIRITLGLAIGLAIRILTLDHAAIEASGYQPDSEPATQARAGLYLAVGGTALVALGVIMVYTRFRAQADDILPERVRPDTVAPPVAGVGAPRDPSDWSVRPEWVPWWRRPGPVAALVAGVVAAVLLVVTVVWLTSQRPGARPDHQVALTGLLVVPPPSAVPPSALPVSEEQAARGEVARLGEDTDAQRLVALLGVRYIAMESWQEGTTTVDVVLLQYASTEDAAQFARTQRDRMASRPGGGDIADIPGVTTGRSVVDPKPDADGRVHVRAVAQRGDIAVLVTETRPAPADRTHLDALVRAQYDRL